MTATTWPALITLCTIALLIWVAIGVGRARGLYGVAAPATTGHPEFERYFRVQMNTLENAVVFLPTLWLSTLYGAHAFLVHAGWIWVAGRVAYAIAYVRDPATRSAAFTVSMLALMVLLGDAGWGLARAVFS
jgi:uncharacterized MAPEG superfamily protein